LPARVTTQPGKKFRLETHAVTSVKFGDEQSVAEIQFLGVKEVVMLVLPPSAF
jgi:hypothetical protein